MNYLLTIIVPIYKIKENDLRICIESLLNQESNEYKIILIDDGSPDNCGQICDEYKKTSNKIEVIHQENRGVSEARNNGIDRTKTDWIFFVDPDDWIEKNSIDIIIESLKNNLRDADIIMFNYFNDYKNETKEEKINIEEGLISNSVQEELRKSPFFKFYVEGKENSYSTISIWNKIYNKKFLNDNKIRFLPEAVKGQDRLFNANALFLTKRVFYLNKTFYHYRCYSESITNKFNQNIVKYTKVEINELKRIIDKYKIQQYSELLNARICTRLYSCMRLFYFNKENKMNIKEIKQQLKKVLSAEPFSGALKSVNWKLLNTQEKIFVFCIKHKLFYCIKLLIHVKEIERDRKIKRDDK